MATKTLDKPQTSINVIYQFFKQVENWCGSSPTLPSVSELEKYLSKDFQLFNNGQLIVKGAATHLNRLKKFQEKYASIRVSKPLEEPLLCGNQGSIYYKLDLTTHQGQHREVFIIALFTIENERIQRWVEVTSEKSHADRWDS
jgi:hypothetical protein